ncbi:MAG: hypothetical protein HKN23_14845 [Verrucomicrobiales bacterium]|nr:hypothetical protein [Verrucomicrobiales bacterium]
MNILKWFKQREAWGGVVAAAIAFLGSWSVGYVSDGKAMDLLKGMLPSTRFMCASVMTATSTILALILTLISFTAQSDKHLKSRYFTRVKQIALLACTGFIAAIILLLIISLPIEEASEKLYPFFRFLYYFVLVYSALLGGLLVTIILKLYRAAAAVIVLIDPDADDTDLLVDEEPEDSGDGE